MLPNFLIIGAKKAGTTSLHRYLRVHPQVWMPAGKRLDFFSLHWERGVGWYESCFAAAGSASAVGEASTSYTRHPLVAGVPGRMAATVPHVRLVYLVRHPLDRMVSQYQQAVTSWGERRPFGEAVTQSPADYVAPSRYGLQIERYLEHFPREQLAVATAEDLRDDREATLRRLLAFLAVDEDAIVDVDRTYNRAADHRRPRRLVEAIRRAPAYHTVRRRLPPSMRRAAWLATSTAVPPPSVDLTGDLRDRLLDQLRPDLVRLRAHIGDGFHCWGLLED